MSESPSEEYPATMPEAEGDDGHDAAGAEAEGFTEPGEDSPQDYPPPEGEDGTGG